MDGLIFLLYSLSDQGQINTTLVAVPIAYLWFN